MSRASTGLLVAVLVQGAWPARAQATTDCLFTFRQRVMALQNDCTTDETIRIPDDFTLDGRGHTITAVNIPGVIVNGNPVGFIGAVVENAGTRANVRGLRITSQDLAVFCHQPDERIRGISLLGASGFIVGNVVEDLNEIDFRGLSGCQEGNGIVAQNVGAAPTEVFIAGNTVTRYQKLGISVAGNVRATVVDNQVTGFGPVGNPAQIGIQIAFGARALVANNTVTGNSYNGPQTSVAATGILVLGGPEAPTCPLPLPCPFTTDVRITRNVITENDQGVVLSNIADPASGTPPDTRTDNAVLENVISKSSVTNSNGIQVGVRDIGNRDRIIGNTISGAGYDPDANPGTSVRPILADPPFAIDPIIRANRIRP